MSVPARVVVVDDERLALSGLESMLTCAGLDVVATARDGWTGVSAVRDHDPDVVVLDLVMPGCDGLAMLLLLRHLGFGVPCLVLTKHDEDHRLLPVMAAGARGFLRKDTDGQEVAAAVLALRAGHVVLSPSAVERLARLAANGATQPCPPLRVAVELKSRRYEISPWSEPALQALTQRQLDVLELVVAGRSNQEIAERLNISVATAKSHVSSVLGKLRLRRRAQIVALFAGVGDDPPQQMADALGAAGPRPVPDEPVRDLRM
ncbi:DNA-binding response regulator [Bailinhaonella thermotolerans]|uniref:DNA-binding response regulator n=1 Tax=Bailinhaonella thermotolerans TaxID=1070861 RepID=A0A3A4AL30_9ACTN|nr:response regulator transcription factor [Bailinhaonella thermotolerans]RJL27207.1 DNA-binding response regulator [Bailinhaonella thermotolerans]